MRSMKRLMIVTPVVLIGSVSAVSVEGSALLFLAPTVVTAMFAPISEPDPTARVIERRARTK